MTGTCPQNWPRRRALSKPRGPCPYGTNLARPQAGRKPEKGSHTGTQIGTDEDSGRFLPRIYQTSESCPLFSHLCAKLEQFIQSPLLLEIGRASCRERCQ